MYSIDKLTKDGSILYLAITILSQSGLLIDIQKCGIKMREITVFL